MRYRELILVLVSLPCMSLSQAPKPSAETSSTVVPAIDGVLAALRTSPLVGLSDYHALAEEEDFYVSLLSDPRFPKQVRNIVVEFGNASQQATIDRYVNGENVSYNDLRKVWGDTSYVGWFPTVTALGYLNFYAAVRATNLKLPVEDRIHVWLGGRPVDWSKISAKEDLSKVVGGQADRYTADLIEEQILKKGGKAVVIYGTFHFFDNGGLGELIRQRHPEALFVITPYTGFEDGSCSDAFEHTLRGSPSPALAEFRQSDLDQRIHTSGCHFVDGANFGGMTESQKAQLRSEMDGHPSAIVGNALLYLGSARMLTKSPLSPDLYLDPEFRNENYRRAALFGGDPDPWPTVRDNPMSPRYLHTYGDPSHTSAK
jgi:hypothetical protein